MEPSPAQQQFWNWFRDNGERLRSLMYSGDEEARDAAVAELRQAGEAAAPNLVLEVARAASPGEPHSRVVSADGHADRADAVKDFAATAPELPGWKVIAFRPRMPIGDSLEIAIEDERIGPDDIWFRVEPGED